MDTETLKGKVFLLVDDEPRLVKLLARQLGRRGHACLTATSGNAALEVLQANPVDIVVSDIRMADGSGVDLLLALREQDFGHVAVVLVSGYADFDEEELLGMGAQLVLSKPFNVDVLLQELCQMEGARSVV